MSKSGSLSEWVSQWVTRSPIELFWTAKYYDNITFCREFLLLHSITTLHSVFLRRVYLKYYDNITFCREILLLHIITTLRSECLRRVWLKYYDNILFCRGILLLHNSTMLNNSEEEGLVLLYNNTSIEG